MALRRITEHPTIADTVLFDVLCPDANGCYLDDNRTSHESDPDNPLVNPYKVSNISIYFLEKSFVSENDGEYVVDHTNGVDQTLIDQYEVAKQTACVSPTEANLELVADLQRKIVLQTKQETIHYNDAKLVASFGDDRFPAWIGSDEDNAFIVHITEDANGDPLYGHFELQWSPKGMREGDYFICWQWSPLPGGDILTAHEFFTLFGATQLTTSIPSHRTQANKYQMLQDRYLPEMFKNLVSNHDLTPYVVRGLNNAVGDGFTMLEDLANQMVDVIDANATGEYYLIPLANLFNLKLRSDDPTLWRRQIKRAIPLLKKKGTLIGLREALAQADVELVKFTKMWQIISSYTWQEYFTFSDSLEFLLSKVVSIPSDTTNVNFELYYRAVDDSAWSLLADTYAEVQTYLSFATIEGKSHITWEGDEPNVGDSIRLIYQIVPPPNATAQNHETYIRDLPLMDLRDERDQKYPPKNWNVHVIEEDDLLFNALIPTRHPYHDYLVWGWVRTEFPYSENVYNMEEYNGSTRESYDPCDIDKDFVDPCSAGQSSKYSVDLNIGTISNDRLAEVQEILREYTPFHAVLHSINIGGKAEDFVQTQENLEIYTHIKGEEVTIAGGGQLIFNRVMLEGFQAKRNALAQMTAVTDSVSCKGYNEHIAIYSPLINFEGIGLNPNNNLLEILNGTNAGNLSIDTPDRNHANITLPSSLVEPFSMNSFTFRVSNKIFEGVTTNIYQDDVFKLTDSSIQFANLGVQTMKDVPSTIPWEVEITSPVGAAGVYALEDVLPDNAVVLYDPTHTLPPALTNDVHFNLRNGSHETIASSIEGTLSVKRRGRVDISSMTELTDVREMIRDIMQKGFYLYVPIASVVTPFRFAGFVDGETHQFYIGNYSAGDRVGALTDLYERLVDNQVGYLYYSGMKIHTSQNYESSLQVQNGNNPPVTVLDNNHFKENFLVLIGTDYYAISQWDGQNIYLVGPPRNWGVGTGTTVAFTIYRFDNQPWQVWEKITAHPTNKPPIAVPAHDFSFVDRRGLDVFEVNTETQEVQAFALATALNAIKRNEKIEAIGQQESVSYAVEYRDKGDQ